MCGDKKFNYCAKGFLIYKNPLRRICLCILPLTVGNRSSRLYIRGKHFNESSSVQYYRWNSKLPQDTVLSWPREYFYAGYGWISEVTKVEFLSWLRLDFWTKFEVSSWLRWSLGCLRGIIIELARSEFSSWLGYIFELTKGKFLSWLSVNVWAD